MAIDNSPRIRQRKHLERKVETRANRKRILIVTEGYTERHYFDELTKAYRLGGVVIKTSKGTSPRNVVDRASDLFFRGDGGLYGKEDFDEVYAVFDRDEHSNYFEALTVAEQLGKKLSADKKHPVVFEAVPSNPCFELWLLLHFQNVSTLMHRNDVLKLIQQKIPGYKKGAEDVYSRISARLGEAIERARLMNKTASPYSQEAPYTGIVSLVEKLQNLKTH